jgi:amino acid transporter
MSATSVPAQPAAGAPTTGALGERRLTTIHAIGQSLAVGPIFSAGLLTGLVASVAGFNTPLSVLLGLLGALGLGYVVSLYAQRYAGAGAIYEYLTRGAHPDVGVFSAGLYALGLLFLGGGGVFIAIGFLTEGFFAAHLDAISVKWWIWGLIGLTITTGLNHFGVRIAIRGVLTLAFLSAIPFVITAIAVILDGGAGGNTLSVFDPGTTSWNDVFNGILFAVTLFIGFEIAASIGEETHDPKRSIPIAVLGTIAIAGLFYLLMTYAAAIGFGERAVGDWAASPSPIGEIAGQYVGKGMATIVDLVVILDAISVAIAFTIGASRIFFALGRDGLLPGAFATTTAHKTPLGGNLVVVFAGIVAIVWAGMTDYGTAVKLPDEIEAFSISAAAGTYLVTAIYVVLAVVGFRLAWETASAGGLWWKLPGVAAGLAMPILAYKGSLDPWPDYPANRGVIFALICLGIVAVWFAFLKARFPDRIRVAAAYAESHHDVPPMDERLDYRPAET